MPAIDPQQQLDLLRLQGNQPTPQGSNSLSLLSAQQGGLTLPSPSKIIVGPSVGTGPNEPATPPEPIDWGGLLPGGSGNYPLVSGLADIISHPTTSSLVTSNPLLQFAKGPAGAIGNVLGRPAWALFQYMKSVGQQAGYDPELRRRILSGEVTDPFQLGNESIAKTARAVWSGLSGEQQDRASSLLRELYVPGEPLYNVDEASKLWQDTFNKPILGGPVRLLLGASQQPANFAVGLLGAGLDIVTDPVTGLALPGKALGSIVPSVVTSAGREIPLTAKGAKVLAEFPELSTTGARQGVSQQGMRVLQERIAAGEKGLVDLGGIKWYDTSIREVPGVTAAEAFLTEKAWNPIGSKLAGLMATPSMQPAVQVATFLGSRLANMFDVKADVQDLPYMRQLSQTAQTMVPAEIRRAVTNIMDQFKRLEAGPVSASPYTGPLEVGPVHDYIRNFGDTVATGLARAAPELADKANLDWQIARTQLDVIQEIGDDVFTGKITPEEGLRRIEAERSRILSSSTDADKLLSDALPKAGSGADTQELIRVEGIKAIDDMNYNAQLDALSTALKQGVMPSQLGNIQHVSQAVRDSAEVKAALAPVRETQAASRAATQKAISNLGKLKQTVPKLGDPNYAAMVQHNDRVDATIASIRSGASPSTITDPVFQAALKPALDSAASSTIVENVQQTLKNLSALRKDVPQLADPQFQRLLDIANESATRIAKAEKLDSPLEFYITRLWEPGNPAGMAALRFLRRELTNPNRFAEPRTFATWDEFARYAVDNGLDPILDMPKVMAIRAAYSAKNVVLRDLINQVRSDYGVAEMKWQPMSEAASGITPARGVVKALYQTAQINLSQSMQSYKFARAQIAKYFASPGTLAKAVLADLPKIPEGSIRLYRGEDTSLPRQVGGTLQLDRSGNLMTSVPTPGSWYTSSLDEALAYTTKIVGNRYLSYVDVPESVARTLQYSPSQYILSDPYLAGIKTIIPTTTQVREHLETAFDSFTEQALWHHIARQIKAGNLGEAYWYTEHAGNLRAWREGIKNSLAQVVEAAPVGIPRNLGAISLQELSALIKSLPDKKPGMFRLYRAGGFGDQSNAVRGPRSGNTPSAQAAVGKWYTSSIRQLPFYLEERASHGGSELRYVDVTKAEYDASKVSNLDKSISQFSANPTVEHFLSDEIVARSASLNIPAPVGMDSAAREALKARDIVHAWLRDAGNAYKDVTLPDRGGAIASGAGPVNRINFSNNSIDRLVEKSGKLMPYLSPDDAARLGDQIHGLRDLADKLAREQNPADIELYHNLVGRAQDTLQDITDRQAFQAPRPTVPMSGALLDHYKNLVQQLDAAIQDLTPELVQGQEMTLGGAALSAKEQATVDEFSSINSRIADISHQAGALRSGLGSREAEVFAKQLVEGDLADRIKLVAQATNNPDLQVIIDNALSNAQDAYFNNATSGVFKAMNDIRLALKAEQDKLVGAGAQTFNLGAEVRLPPQEQIQSAIDMYNELRRVLAHDPAASDTYIEDISEFLKALNRGRGSFTPQGQLNDLLTGQRNVGTASKSMLDYTPRTLAGAAPAIDTAAGISLPSTTNLDYTAYDQWLYKQHQSMKNVNPKNASPLIFGQEGHPLKYAAEQTLKDISKFIPNPELQQPNIFRAGSIFPTDRLVHYDSGNFAGYLIPDSIASELNRVQQAFNGPAGYNAGIGARALVRGMDAVNNWYQRMSTVPRPNFHEYNIFSNVSYNMAQMGAAALDPGKNLLALKMSYLNDPKNPLLRAILAPLRKLGVVKGTPEDWATELIHSDTGLYMTLADAVKVQQDHGIYQVGMLGAHQSSIGVGQLVRDQMDDKGLWQWRSINPFSHKFAPVRAGVSVGTGIESQARSLSWLWNWQKTGDAFQAAEQTRKFMIDYATGLTPFEQAFLRRNLMFYNFFKQNTLLQAQLLARYPGRQAAWLTFQKDMAQNQGISQEEANLYGDYITNNMGIAVSRDPDGTVNFISGRSFPIGDAISLLSGPAKLVDNILGRLSPTLRNPIESRSNYSFFTSRAINDPTTQNYYRHAFGALDSVPALRSWLKLTRTEYTDKSGETQVFYSADPERMYWFQALLPGMYSTAQALAKPLTAPEQGGTRAPGAAGLTQGLLGSLGTQLIPAEQSQSATRAILPSSIDEQKYRAESSAALDANAQMFQSGQKSSKDWLDARATILADQRSKLKVLYDQGLQREGLTPAEYEALSKDRHAAMDPNNQLLDSYHAISPENFKGADQAVDWNAYSRAKKDFESKLSPEESAYITEHSQDYIANLPQAAATVEKRYQAARTILDNTVLYGTSRIVPFMGVEQDYIDQHKGLQALVDRSFIDPRLADHPAIKAMHEYTRNMHQAMLMGPQSKQVIAALRAFYPQFLPKELRQVGITR